MIHSFFGIRFLLALSVLLVHLPFPKEHSFGIFIDSLLNNAGLAVMWFFILSGFCTSLAHSNDFDTLSKANALSYYRKRLSKFYPLYFVTTLWAFLYSIALLHSPKDLAHFSAAFLLALSLSQSLTVFYSGVMNGACWFLSALFFCYLATPFLLHAWRHISKKQIIAFLLFSYAISLILFLGAFYLPENARLLFLYTTPYVRIFHYASGLLLGLLFLKTREKNISPKNALSLEILSLFLCAFAFLFNEIFHLSQTNQVSTLLYIPTLLFSTWVFAKGNGPLSKFLGNKPLRTLGGISMELYLLHYVVIYFGGEKLFHFLPQPILCATLFFLSFGFSFAWKAAQKFKKKKAPNP